MAKPSYFQAVITRGLDAAPIRPASGLLTRWSQVSDMGSAPARRVVRPTLAAEAQSTTAAPSQAPRFVQAPDDAITARADGATSPLREPDGPLTEAPLERRRREQASAQDGASPPVNQVRWINPQLQPMQPTRPITPAASPPARIPTPEQLADIQPGQRARLQRAQHQASTVPLVSPPAQERLPAQAAAEPKIVHERIERQVVMPPPLKPAQPVPPPAMKQATTVEIGSIEVRVIREVAPAPAVTARHAPAQPSPTVAPVTQPSAPISRRMGVGHGFHQS